MAHLSNDDINGYIHHTLSDAQRETMNRHLDHCPQCRERVSHYERQQQMIYHDISDKLRPLRSPVAMSFAAIRPGLNRSRKLAGVRHVSGMALTGVGAVSVMALAAFAILFAYQWANARLTASPPEPPVMASTLFPYAWEDQTPFANGLIRAEQAALGQIHTAPVYHVDLQFDTDLPRINGLQEMRYVNNRGWPLNALYFRLLPGMEATNMAITEASVNGQPAEAILESPTTLRIPLSETLMPYETVVVALKFNMQTEGADKNTLMLAHFQPTLEILEDEAWRFDRPIYGMDVLPEPSFFLYNITAPRNLAVISNGQLIDQNLEWADGAFQTRHTFAAGPTTQLFAFVSDDMAAVAETVEGETRIIRYAAGLAAPQDINIYTHTMAAMAVYNETFGAYPFTELKLIFTDAAAENISSLPGVLVFASGDGEETAVIQQAAEGLAQQWFGRIVAGNTLLEPWLAQAPGRYAARYYLVEKGVLSENELRQSWQSTLNTADMPDDSQALIGQTAHDFSPTAFTEMVHYEGPQFMAALAQTLGESTMRQFLGDYYQTYKWETPSTALFQQLAEDVCQCTVSPLFESWVTGKQADPEKTNVYE